MLVGKRTGQDLVGSVLRVVLFEREICYTRILQKANLTTKVLNRLVDELCSAGYVKVVVRDGRDYFVITNEGIEWFLRYETTRRMLLLSEKTY